MPYRDRTEARHFKSRRRERNASRSAQRKFVFILLGGVGFAWIVLKSRIRIEWKYRKNDSKIFEDIIILKMIY